jgi:hypothetical protein
MSLYVPCYRPYSKHNTNIHAPGGIFFLPVRGFSPSIHFFEPTILVSERPKTDALDRTATGIGNNYMSEIYKQATVMLYKKAKI